VEGDFSFTVKTEFETKIQYDQCGIILYQDSENWMKASVEYENTDFARLGSVVTNLGFSDWATANVPASTNVVWYRLSRRKQDFYLESSPDGMQYQQMRMFHMYNYITVSKVGVYACSPLESSFKAHFSAFELSGCRWPDHHN
jgi:regulation of enolase protein 1 (concanavalin A-like superfamily)